MSSESDSIEREVFVLGAGFTRAFLPDSPLMVDDYDAATLAENFNNFPLASRILDRERSRDSQGHINIERLLTRLDGGMPYDQGQGAFEELGLLTSEVKLAFLGKIKQARDGEYYATEMAKFAEHCLRQNINCITFNYDDILDEALWKFRADERAQSPSWHPDDGYGFYCAPSILNVANISQAAGNFHSSILYLKLHGSINWYSKLGHTQPYFANAIAHHEPWSPYASEQKLLGIQNETLDRHLEPEPFIVPPVLMKSVIVEEPILRLIWNRAFRALQEAEKVTFIGYSFPLTDIAVRTLFEEALHDLPRYHLHIVNLEATASKQAQIRQTYKTQFDRESETPESKIPESNFFFSGALEWSRTLSTS